MTGIKEIQMDLTASVGCTMVIKGIQMVVMSWGGNVLNDEDSYKQFYSNNSKLIL